MAFERGHYDGTGSAGTAIGKEHLTGVGNPHQPALRHFEDAELTGGTKTVLRCAHDAQCVVTVALE